MNRFGVIGISHRRATVEEIGLFTRSVKNTESVAHCLGVEECLVLSTCNRVEIYWANPRQSPADEILERFIQSDLGRENGIQELAETAAYALSGEAAVKHLFLALAGLDSLVLGDEQIMGQFRRALQTAQDHGHCRDLLRLLADDALKAAKHVRAATDFSKRPTSLAEVAVVQLRERLRGESEPTVLLLGGGDIVRATAARLKGWKGVQLIFVNRSLAGATSLAELHGGRAMTLQDYQTNPIDFNALVAATSAEQPVLHAADLAGLPQRAQPRLLLDLGVPADLDPSLGDDPRFLRRDVLELGRLAEDGRQEAENLIRNARPLLRERLSVFRERLFGWDLRPLARQLREDVHQRAQAELKRFFAGSLSHLNVEDRAEVQKLVERAAEKTVQVPLVAMRQSAREIPNGEGTLRHLVNEADSEDRS